VLNLHNEEGKTRWQTSEKGTWRRSRHRAVSYETRVIHNSEKVKMKVWEESDVSSHKDWGLLRKKGERHTEQFIHALEEKRGFRGKEEDRNRGGKKVTERGGAPPAH